MAKIDKKSTANFLISIYHQENHSYQGEIKWLDTGKRQCFRSELELLNLIHEAAQSSGTTMIRTWEDDQTITAV